MVRKNGFIRVDEMLEEVGVDTSSLDSISKNPNVTLIKNNNQGFHISFPYKGETYFYKHCFSILDGSFIDCYNELVAEELAKDFGISCVDYDIAALGSYRGVISKNYKLDNAVYIPGKKVFNDRSYKDDNTLENIWDALEYRYQNHPNKREIISDLMRKIINIYLFDIISCQNDRHSSNWELMISGRKTDIGPLFDNDRILLDGGKDAVVGLGIDFDSYIPVQNLLESIQSFQYISNEEFTSIIKEKLWIISNENLNKVFEKIEKKTGISMPLDSKLFYLCSYQEHRKKLEKILEEEKDRKR